MHVPPPPPALAPPPPTFALANTEKPALTEREQQGRNALLSDITKGTRLKKTVTNDRSAPIFNKPKGGGDGGGGGGGCGRFGGSWSVRPLSLPSGAQCAGPRPFRRGGNSVPRLPVPRNHASGSPHLRMTPPRLKTPSGLPPPISKRPRPNQSTPQNRSRPPLPRGSWPPPPMPHSSRPLLPPGPNRATEDLPPLVPVSNGPSLPPPRDSLPSPPPPSFRSKPPLPPSSSASSRPPSKSAPPGLPDPPSIDQRMLCSFLMNLSLRVHPRSIPPLLLASQTPCHRPPPKSHQKSPPPAQVQGEGGRGAPPSPLM